MLLVTIQLNYIHMNTPRFVWTIYTTTSFIEKGLIKSTLLIDYFVGFTLTVLNHLSELSANANIISPLGCGQK